MQILLFHQENKRIYVIREHRYALFCWRKAIENKLIEKPAFLLHIDAHTDFTFSESHEEGAHHLLEFDDLKTIGYIQLLNPDNSEFIVNAMLANIIKDGLCVFRRHCKDYGETTPECLVVQDHHFHLHQTESLQTLKDHVRTHPMPEEFILDIDLDFFTYRNQQVYPRHSEDLMLQLQSLQPIWDKAKIITIALEPECCGGKTHCKEILHAIDTFLLPGITEAEKLLEP